MFVPPVGPNAPVNWFWYDDIHIGCSFFWPLEMLAKLRSSRKCSSRRKTWTSSQLDFIHLGYAALSINTLGSGLAPGFLNIG
jgi:hypothetical protein